MDPRGLDAEPLAELARLIERGPSGQVTRGSGAPPAVEKYPDAADLSRPFHI